MLIRPCLSIKLILCGICFCSLSGIAHKNKNDVDGKHYSLVYQAISSCDDKELIRILKTSKCANYSNHWGETPLIFAIKENKYRSRDVVGSLLAHGADIAVTDKAGFSALDYALLQGDDEMVRLLLDSMVVATVPQNQFVSDISFGIVDLKFDGENLKICELGEGPRSMFKGYDKLYKQGELWHRLWHFLSCLQLTPWLTTYGFTNEMRLENALSEYEELGGGYAHNLEALSKDTVFNDCVLRKKTYDYFSLYNTVLLLRNNGYRDRSLYLFRRQHPTVLPLCDALGPFGNSKVLMNSLFEQDVALAKYRPRCLVLEKKYKKSLAKEITDKLQCDCYVIKPINSSKGNGIIVVKKRDLYQLLRKILKNPQRLPNLNDPTYGYWLRDRNKSFLVEEYAPSRLITVKSKQYDATMRVVFVLFNDVGRIGVTFLGSYWKLPTKSVSEAGDLTEQHKSSIKPDKIGVAEVALTDYENVKTILRKVLPALYLKMLQDRENHCKKQQKS